MLQSCTRFIDCAAVSLLAIAGLAVIGPQVARGVGTTLSMSNCLGSSQADCSNCIQTSNGVSTTSYKCTSTTGVQACVDTDESGNCITAGE